MLNVTDATKTAYTNNSVPKALTIYFPNRNITFNNSDIKSESFTLTEAIEKESYLTFKGCIASQCKFQIADNVQDLRGEYVEISIKAGTTETIPLFKGYVDEQNNETHEDIITEFTCYDALYKIGSRNMQAWVNALTYPITIRNFRNSLFSNLGITQESKMLINDGLSISANFKTFCDNPSATDIMKWICEVNGVFGQIGRDGQFKYRELKEIAEGLYPSETTYPSPTTYPSDENVGIYIDTSEYTRLEYEPYACEMISKVVIYDSGGLDVAYSGSGTNVFGICDNPIAYNVPMQAAVNALMAKVGALNYIPVVKMECVGLPYIECGDTYLSYTKKYVCRSYVLERTLKGIQALKDTYDSDSDQLRPEHKSTSTSRENANKQSILTINAQIVQMNEVIAKKATIDQLNAVDGKINTLTAKAITTDNFSAQKIDAGNITAGTLNVDRIQAGSIQAQKLNVSASDGNGWGVSFGSGGSSFSKGSYAATGLTGSIGGGRGWGVNFGNYGESGSMSLGTLDATSITTGYLNANRIQAGSISVDKLNTSSLNSWDLSTRSLSAQTVKATTLKVGGGSGAEYHATRIVVNGTPYWVLAQ